MIKANRFFMKTMFQTSLLKIPPLGRCTACSRRSCSGYLRTPAKFLCECRVFVALAANTSLILSIYLLLPLFFLMYCSISVGILYFGILFPPSSVFRVPCEYAVFYRYSRSARVPCATVKRARAQQYHQPLCRCALQLPPQYSVQQCTLYIRGMNYLSCLARFYFPRP